MLGTARGHLAVPGGLIPRPEWVKTWRDPPPRALLAQGRVWGAAAPGCCCCCTQWVPGNREGTQTGLGARESPRLPAMRRC